MTALIITGSILLFFLLISLVRVRVIFLYDDSAEAVLKVLFFSVKLYPPKPIEKAEKPPGAEAQVRRAFSSKEILELIRHILEVADKFRTGIVIDELTFHFSAGNEDPSKAAMMYGGASAAFGLIWPILENNFKIKKREVRISVDFSSPNTRVYTKAAISLAVWQLVWIAAVYGPRIMRVIKREQAGGHKKSEKATPMPA